MPSKNFDQFLAEELRNPELAAEYLSVSVEDGTLDQFLIALRNVADAHGGIGALSDITNLNRQSMYKMLSGEGNPTLASLIIILKAIGVNLSFTAAEKDAA